MQAQKPDCRVFASYPMPAKIDLLNERPRCESQVEKQLEHQIGQISPNQVPKITVNEQTTATTSVNSSRSPSSMVYQPVTLNHGTNYQQMIDDTHSSPSSKSEVRETRIVVSRHSSPIGLSPVQNNEQQQYVDNRQQQQPQQFSNQTTTITNTTNINRDTLLNELAEKEARLMREIEALKQRPYSPYQAPSKINLSAQQQQQQQQQQYQYNTSPRPHSSASSTSADLLEKEAKLLKEIEEIESKPFNPQTMVVEKEHWYEYPENMPDDRHLTDSRRRVRDFCSMPNGLAQDRFLHEDNLTINSQRSPTPGSIHTTIIRSPKREIDNKSPLPFAFDNFTTKGVRGNIATVGAVEPDRPRPPIFPIVKRTPSPAFAQH